MPLAGSPTAVTALAAPDGCVWTHLCWLLDCWGNRETGGCSQCALARLLVGVKPACCALELWEGTSSGSGLFTGVARL